MEDRDGAKPDARLFNLMIHTYGKAGKITESQNLFRKMKSLGFPLSAVTFNSLMAFQNTVPDAEACLRQVIFKQLFVSWICRTWITSGFQACDKVESTLCLPWPFLQRLNIRCICNFTTMKHNRVILVTQWDHFGRRWSHMIFHWLFYIQYE